MVTFFNLPTPSQNDQYYFEALDKALDSYSRYDRIVLAEDFNPEEKEACLETFLYQHDFKNLVKKVLASKILQNLQQ